MTSVKARAGDVDDVIHSACLGSAFPNHSQPHKLGLDSSTHPKHENICTLAPLNYVAFGKHQNPNKSGMLVCMQTYTLPVTRQPVHQVTMYV